MRIRLLLLCSFLGLLVPRLPAETPTNTRVMEIVKRTVGESGQSIIGLGSWVSGKKYGDPLKGGASDHDMRLLLPKGTTPEAALAQWQAARKKIIEEVQKEFGADGGKVLATMNLYPPTQLMTDVESPADALETFRRLGVSPKLSYTGPAEAIPPSAAEGLYGAGANTWTQRYEETAGKLIYKEGDVVYTGMTDLTHMSEGVGTYTTGGMANTARQWAEHGEEALSKGQGDKVAKYLERLERDIMKARDLQRFDIHGASRDEMHTLMQELKAHPDHLIGLEGRVQAVLQRSKLESAVLARVERAGLAQKAVLRVMLDALDTHSVLSQALRDAAEKVPAEKLVSGITAFIAISEMSTAAGEGDPGKVLVAAAPWLLPLGPAILAQIAQGTIDAAKDAGFALMASSQEPFDLLAGIYTAGGRPDPNGKNYTLDQLVAAYSDEAKLKSFVFALAQRAADRNAGDATAAADRKVADAIMARCFPVILRAWRAKREALATEYLDLADILRTAAPRLRYNPNPAARDKASGKAAVTVTAESSDKQFATHRERMLAIMKILHGAGCFVSVTDRWDSGGKEGGASNQQVYSYAKDGVYTVHLNESIVAGGSPLPKDSPLAFKAALNSSVDVTVGGSGAALVIPPPNILCIDVRMERGHGERGGFNYDNWTCTRGPEDQFKKPSDFTRYAWQWQGTRFKGESAFQVTSEDHNSIKRTFSYEIGVTGEATADMNRLVTATVTCNYTCSDGSKGTDVITVRDVPLRNDPGTFRYTPQPDTKLEKEWRGAALEGAGTFRKHIVTWQRTFKSADPSGDRFRDAYERDRTAQEEVWTGDMLAKAAEYSTQQLLIGFYQRVE